MKKICVECGKLFIGTTKWTDNICNECQSMIEWDDNEDRGDWEYHRRQDERGRDEG